MKAIRKMLRGIALLIFGHAFVTVGMAFSGAVLLIGGGIMLIGLFSVISACIDHGSAEDEQTAAPDAAEKE